MPYLQVMRMKSSTTGLFHSKSFVMLIVGMGKVNTRPLASPSSMTAQNARLNRSISSWKSPYVSSRHSPPMMTGSSRSVLGTLMSNVRLENGHWKPTRVGTLMLNTNSCRHWRTWSKVIWS